MIQERAKIVEGDLLYHPVHGTCRVNQISKQGQSGKQLLYYSLVPRLIGRMKVRFVISAGDMETSGFHALVSRKEANRILDYLKEGDRTNLLFNTNPKTSSSFAEQNQTWNLARAILSFSYEKFEAKDQRKRHILERSAKGLIGELASVFKITLKEASSRVQDSLGEASKINPLVLLALAEIGRDEANAPL